MNLYIPVGPHVIKNLSESPLEGGEGCGAMQGNTKTFFALSTIQPLASFPFSVTEAWSESNFLFQLKQRHVAFELVSKLSCFHRHDNSSLKLDPVPMMDGSPLQGCRSETPESDKTTRLQSCLNASAVSLPPQCNNNVTSLEDARKSEHNRSV